MESCYSFILEGKNTSYIIEYSLHNVKTCLWRTRNHQNMGWICFYLVFLSWSLCFWGKLISITMIKFHTSIKKNFYLLGQCWWDSPKEFALSVLFLHLGLSMHFPASTFFTSLNHPAVEGASCPCLFFLLVFFFLFVLPEGPPCTITKDRTPYSETYSLLRRNSALMPQTVPFLSWVTP